MRHSAAPSSVVAIPIRNEVERIGACLEAIAGQEGGPPDSVVLLLNNCDDGTQAVVSAMAPGFPAELHVVVHDFAPGEGSAGAARAMAMDIAADVAAQGGVLLTTDADGRVAPDWLARTRQAMRGGADAVAGRAVMDTVEALLIPRALHDDDDDECGYGAMVDEIASLLDPDPADPWPRHAEASGASLAVTLDWYRRIGGMPRMAAGEDRAFAAALRRHDARIRHAPEVWVTVSGRTEGRAVGGMADTIRRRMICPDAFLDDRLEPVADAARRARLRHQARRAFRAGGSRHADQDLADLLGIGRDHLEMLFSGNRWFGTAWDEIEAAAPSLRRRRVPAADVGRETRAAAAILRRLRGPDEVMPVADAMEGVARLRVASG